MLKYRPPDFVLGFVLATAIWAGALIWQSLEPSKNPSHAQRATNAEYITPYYEPFIRFWNWTTNDAVSFYTSVLAVFTAVLGTVAIFQIRYLRRADQATQRTIILTQRPRLRVRNVVVRHPANYPRDSAPLFTKCQPLQVQFYVANIGGTSATITDAHGIIFQSRSGLPMRRPYEGKNANLPIPPFQLLPGQSYQFQFTSDEAIGDGAETIGTESVQKLRLFVMGWVEYLDDTGVIRRIAFCREFKRGPWEEGGFRRVKNRDYEHEE